MTNATTRSGRTASSRPSSTRQRLKALLRASLSEATQKAYASDLRHYRQVQGPLPAKPSQVALYLAKCSSSHACATLSRRMAALDRWHQSQGYASPVKSPVVREALRGIRRLYGERQRQVRAITARDLSKLLKVARSKDGNTPSRTYRDCALVLLGFAAALRRSELVALNVDDLAFGKEGLQVHIRRSKTDQFAKGQVIRVPYGKRTGLCAVTAVRQWLEHAQIKVGAVLRPVDRYGCVGAAALTPQSVALVLKRLATAALGASAAATISGHSLRAGYCTDAAQRGVSIFAIRQVSRHRSVETLGRYVRGEL